MKMQIVIGFHLGRAEISAGRYRKSIATLKSTQQNLSGGNVAVADGKIAAALSERLAFALYCNGELKEAMAEAKRARLLAEGNNDLSLSATLLVGNLTSHPTLSVQILKLVRSQLFKRRKKGDLMEEEILSGCVFYFTLSLLLLPFSLSLSLSLTLNIERRRHPLCAVTRLLPLFQSLRFNRCVFVE